MELSKVESKINYVFKDKNLLTRAFTLASFDQQDNNQILEFFGDAILEFLVSERIYDENKTEGELTVLRQSIVSDAALTLVSKKLGLDKFLIKDKNDSKNKKAVPSVYEALVAAIYLDGGLPAVRKFVVDTLNFENISQGENYKGELQELLQSKKLPVPDYKKNTKDIGTIQRHYFRTRIKICGRTFTGEGDSMTEAQTVAAKAALEYLKQGDR